MPYSVTSTAVADCGKQEAEKNGGSSSAQVSNAAKPTDSGAAASTHSPNQVVAQADAPDGAAPKDTIVDTPTTTETTQKAATADVADAEIAASDVDKLKESLGSDVTEQLIALYKKVLADPTAKPQTHGTVRFPQIERSARGPLHGVSRIFNIMYYRSVSNMH